MKKHKKIVTVDDSLTNQIALKNILKPFYEIYPVSSAARMFDLLQHVRVTMPPDTDMTNWVTAPSSGMVILTKLTTEMITGQTTLTMQRISSYKQKMVRLREITVMTCAVT